MMGQACLEAYGFIWAVALWFLLLARAESTPDQHHAVLLGGSCGFPEHLAGPCRVQNAGVDGLSSLSSLLLRFLLIMREREPPDAEAGYLVVL